MFAGFFANCEEKEKLSLQSLMNRINKTEILRISGI